MWVCGYVCAYAQCGLLRKPHLKMCAGLRGQIYAQINQREYVPAQEHNYVVPRGAVCAHNAQRRLYMRMCAPFGARISAGRISPIFHGGCNTKSTENAQKCPM